MDFIPRDSSLIMRENSTKAAISISIMPDDLPEDIESFYVIIDDVTLIGESKLGGKPSNILRCKYEFIKKDSLHQVME